MRLLLAALLPLVGAFSPMPAAAAGRRRVALRAAPPPAAAVTLVKAGDEAMRARDAAAAAAAYSEAAALCPDDTAVQFRLGSALMSGPSPRPAEVISCMVPSAPSPWYRLPSVTANPPNPAPSTTPPPPPQAAGAFRRAAELSPGAALLWYNTGVALTAAQADNTAEAKAAFERAAACDPALEGAHYNLGALAQDAGDVAAALRHYAAAAKANPENANTAYNAGTCHSALAASDAAVEAYRLATTLDPTMAVAHANLGMERLKPAMLGNDAEVAAARRATALGSLRQALALDPEQHLAAHMLAAADESGESAPAIASEAYVKTQFDTFASRFESTLVTRLGYRAPEDGVRLLEKVAPGFGGGVVVDCGAGTGLAGPLLRPLADELVAVDLSEKMLAEARKKALYDRVVVGEVAEVLARDYHAAAGTPVALVASFDTFIYIGDLVPFFAAAQAAVAEGGYLLFSTERATEEELGVAANAERGWLLRPSGRYAHSFQHLRDLAAAHGFEVLEMHAHSPRVQASEPIVGMIGVMRRTAGAV